MTRVSLSNNPLFLGFDQVERALDRVSKAATDGYPPYNVEQVSDDRLIITLAVAGFGPEDLRVQVEDNQLLVRGRQADEGERVYLHRGIAARQFQRSFVLAEGIEVAATARPEADSGQPRPIPTHRHAEGGPDGGSAA
jgi:HSP20 family molecular chaperone IbpA